MFSALQNLFRIPQAHAHEAYVLTSEEFSGAWQDPSDILAGLITPLLVLEISIAAIVAVLVLIYIERHWGGAGTEDLEKKGEWGHALMRIAAGVVFLASALTGHFLGTEMSMPAGAIGLLMTILAGSSLILGVLPRAGALLGAILLGVAAVGNWPGILNYAYYLAVFAAIWFGAKNRMLPAVVRIAYGFALLYAAVSVKILHPAVALAVVNKYGLANLPVFPSDPALIVLGAGLVEAGIAILILLGMVLRPVLLASLVVATAALFYLPEAPWPHLIMYGVSAYLLLTPQKYAVDNLLRSKKPA